MSHPWEAPREGPPPSERWREALRKIAELQFAYDESMTLQAEMLTARTRHQIEMAQRCRRAAARQLALTREAERVENLRLRCDTDDEEDGFTSDEGSSCASRESGEDGGGTCLHIG